MGVTFFQKFPQSLGRIEVLPNGPVEVVMCGNRLNRVEQRDPNEDLIGSPRDSSTRLWHRPDVPPSAYPVPTEYPKFDSITRLFDISFESPKMPVSMIQR